MNYDELRKDQYARVEWAARNLAPRPTCLVIVFEASEDHPVYVVHPAAEFMAMLLHGWLVRHMRWVADNDRGRPIIEGDGDLLSPMTEQEAIEYIAWKDVPVIVQQAHARGNRARIMICDKEQLPSRALRNAWRLEENAVIIDQDAAHEIRMRRLVDNELQKRLEGERAKIEREIRSKIVQTTTLI